MLFLSNRYLIYRDILKKKKKKDTRDFLWCSLWNIVNRYNSLSLKKKFFLTFLVDRSITDFDHQIRWVCLFCPPDIIFSFKSYFMIHHRKDKSFISKNDHFLSGNWLSGRNKIDKKLLILPFLTKKTKKMAILHEICEKSKNSMRKKKLHIIHNSIAFLMNVVSAIWDQKPQSYGTFSVPEQIFLTKSDIFVIVQVR